MEEIQFETIHFSEGNEKFKGLSFTINNIIYELGPNVPLTTTLLEFIRGYANLTGTKRLCHEGGCGACTVVRTVREGQTAESSSILSCQTLVYSCLEWNIETIEHMGNKREGFDTLQLALHRFGGTQCGYCTPGFLMTMCGRQRTSNELTTKQIEQSLDGNLCRCTGYRPIIDAFKCFASDAPDHLKKTLSDIEDAGYNNCLLKGKNKINGSAHTPLQCETKMCKPKKCLKIETDGAVWYRPQTIKEVFEILRRKSEHDNVRFVVGNTGQGVYKYDGPFSLYIHILDIAELNKVSTEPVLVIGANVTLNKCIEIFHNLSTHSNGYEHLADVARHWEIVANIAVRNVGSWAGNLMTKHKHPEFPSDIFLTLLSVEARIKVALHYGEEIEISLEEFIAQNMERSIILSLTIPPLTNIVYKSYKITPRAVNAHAYVNAAFKFQLEDDGKIADNPILAFGGINPSFIRAKKTENFLQGRVLSSDSIRDAITILGAEIVPNFEFQDASPAYRKSLAQSLLYKTLKILYHKNVVNDPIPLTPNILSRRSAFSSQQKYDSDSKEWPVNLGIPKLESFYQLTGEAKYMDDVHALPNEVYGAFVQSTIANGIISQIDTTECLKIPGVIDFISAKDIPGENTFFSSPFASPDPVFADQKVHYTGQSIGLVVARSTSIARNAAQFVKVYYKDVQRPVLSIKDAIDKGMYCESKRFESSSKEFISYGNVEEGFKGSQHIVTGELNFGSQFHFPIEPFAARVTPNEQGYDVLCTTQWPTEAQSTIAMNLGIPSNCINVEVLRLGGGFGSKISRAHIVSSASAIAAHKLNKPVRIVLDLTTNMTLIGWREPYLSKYKVGFDDYGSLQAIEINFYADVGLVANEVSSTIAAFQSSTMYYCPNWKIRPFEVNTDTAANTWCRAPGYVASVGTMETILECVAHFLKKDALLVREINMTGKERPQFKGMYPNENLVSSKILPMLKEQAALEERRGKVNEFNKKNRWMKRGMSVVPLRYPFTYISFFQYNVQVVIYEHDGSVVIKHGAVEMGQGVNTKVAQVAAKFLGVPLDLVKVKSCDVFAGANSSSTAASHGSDLSSYGAKICCERIRQRMEPIVDKLNDRGDSNPNWLTIVKNSFSEGIDLSERYFTFSQEHPKGYDVWGIACVEVELDVLTGQYLIVRADVIEDCGKSLNPFIDIGQIEGAFAMGLGYFTTEKVKYNPETGQKLSNGTWEYKPLTALDMPADLRVTILPNSTNNTGVLQSKATGEPAVCMGYAAVTALREAITSAREDAGHFDWFDIDTPLTVEDIHMFCKVNPKDFN